MEPLENIHIGVTGSAAESCAGLIDALRGQGWGVTHIEDIQECIASTSAAAYHMVVVVCTRPDQLRRQLVQGLLALRADMSVVFMVPENWPEDRRGVLAGVTFDQIYSLATPTSDLMDAFRDELRSVLLDQAQYVIVCVDDDNEFLASLKRFLPNHLRALSGRVDLDFEFYNEPAEALAACEQMDPQQLAVIVSDQVMPHISGIELLTRVKELHPAAKRVLLTGHAGLDSAVDAINKQVLNKYIFKPVDPLDFSESIRLLQSEYHHGLRAELRRNRMMSQFEYIRSITAARRIEEVLRCTEEFLNEQIKPTHAMIALMRDDQLILQTSTMPAEGLSVGRPIPTDRGIWSWLLRHRRPIRAARQDELPEDVRPCSPLPLMAAPLIRDKVLLGAIMVSGRSGREAFSREESLLMNFVADAAAMVIASFEDRKTIERNYVSTMASLMETVEAKDSYTRGHTERVREFAGLLAEAAGVTGRSLQEIKWAAALHDIGKIAVPDALLSKTSPLTAEEYDIVKEHPIRADKILQHLAYFDVARIIIRGHHESYDGKGYPDGLAGEEIPLGARILAIVDSYDAMTSFRSYRDAMKPGHALAELEANAGRQFDPRLVAMFVEIMRTRLASLTAVSRA